MISSNLLSEALEETKKISSMDVLVADDDGTVTVSTRAMIFLYFSGGVGFCVVNINSFESMS